MLSAVILTHGDGKGLQQCVTSVRFCDEIIVVIDGPGVTPSDLAGVKLLRHDLNGDFATQRNFALRQTKGDWVLFVDDDEIVSAKLTEEIKQMAAQTSEAQGYYLRRQDYFWNKPLRFGETARVKFLRLAKRNAGFWERPVHEVWQVTGPTATLTEPLQHYPHPSVKEFLDSVNFYTTLDAKILPLEGKDFSYLRLVLNPIGKFLQNYFLRLGILDGWPGLVVAFMMSFHSLTVRVKIWEHKYGLPATA